MNQAHCLSKKSLCQHASVFFPLLAFAIPLIARTIPEILIGQFIVGFDTMAFYVPNTLQWLRGSLDFWDFFSVAPLFYAILMFMVKTGFPIVIAIKVLSPLFLGLLGLSIYFFAHKGLGWSSIKSLMPAVLGTVYFVALRISWDMLRNELGLIFLFVVLTLLTQTKNSSWKRSLLLSIFMLGVVFSHQLVSVIMFGIIVFAVFSGLYRKNFIRSINLIATVLPAALFFSVFYYANILPTGFQEFGASGVSILANWLGFASYQSMIVSEVGFFLYCFLPLLPIAVLSFRRLVEYRLRSWLVISIILLLIPFASVSPYRWLLLLIYPLVFYVTDSVSKLKTIKWKRFKFTVARIAVLYLIGSTVILSFGYILEPPEQPFVYFNPRYTNNYSYQIPTSMLQNTISIADFRNTENALQWFKDGKNESAILLTHTVFYSWAILTIDNHQVIDYKFDDPAKAAMNAIEEGHTNIYLIWWINGEGWYAQSTLPSTFQEVFHSGRIAIYQYDISMVTY